jgi:flagellar hook-length control protein FliK
LKGRADRAGAGRSSATAAARSDPASPGVRAADALTTSPGSGPQPSARGAHRSAALVARAALEPTATAPAAGRTPVKADAATETQGPSPDRATDALESGSVASGRATARTVAAADKGAAGSLRGSATATHPMAGAGALNVTTGASRADPGAVIPQAGPEQGTAGAGDAARRLTVAVEGEKVTIELRQAQPGSAKAQAPVPETARAFAVPGATPAAAPRHRVADMERRAPDASAGTLALAAQTKGSAPRAKGQDDLTSAAGAQAALTLAGRATESAPTPARSPENPVATPAQAPGQAPAGIIQPSAAALPSAALHGAALPAQRLRNGPGPLTAGAGDGVRALGAAADRARLAASATSGGAEAEAAQRVAGSDTSAASSAAQAASWMQALEAAVLQVGAESPHGVSPDATASPGLAPVAGESSTRTDASVSESGTLPRIDAAPDSPQFPGMLGARVAAMVRDGVEQARIALNPQELGPVSVQIEMAGTQVRVDLAAEVEATRVALEQALPALAGSLREAGFTLAGGGVFQQARDGGSGDLPSGGSRQGGGTPTARADSTEPVPAPRAPRPQGLVDLYA